MANVFPKARAYPRPCLVSLAFSVLLLVTTAKSDELEELKPCSFVTSDWADGDSFLVKLPDGKEKVFRLYYVDCIEQSISDESDARRLREQSRYFGVSDVKISAEHGKNAARFTAEQLSKPFTIHTSFAEARGRSGKPRFYAFVTTSDGRDLGQRLVENGLARTVGIGRETPTGTPRDEWDAFLKDLELGAALRGIGIWKHSDPEQIVAMRKEERDEMRALKAIDDALAVTPPTSPIDVNSASLEELMRAGLTEARADAVIRKRPFKSIDELDEVENIGEVTLEKVRPYLKIGTKPAP